MLPWKLRKRCILPVSQNLSSVSFSLVKFQLVSCNLSLAMVWQMTYTHKLPKLCSATLLKGSNPVQAWIFFLFGLSFRNCISCVYNSNDLPSNNSSLRSSHIWFSYIHNFKFIFVNSSSWLFQDAAEHYQVTFATLGKRRRVGSPFSLTLFLPWFSQDGANLLFRGLIIANTYASSMRSRVSYLF